MKYTVPRDLTYKKGVHMIRSVQVFLMRRKQHIHITLHCLLFSLKHRAPLRSLLHNVK